LAELNRHIKIFQKKINDNPNSEKVKEWEVEIKKAKSQRKMATVNGYK